MSVRARLGSSVDEVITEMNDVTEEGERALEECAGYCRHLQTSLDSLAESGLKWCDEARGSAENKAQEQLKLIRETDTAVQDLLKVSLGLSQKCPHLWSFHLTTCLFAWQISCVWRMCSSGCKDLKCVELMGHT